MGKGQPYLPDIKTFILAGINPRTRLPKKLETGIIENPSLKPSAKRLLRIVDEQRAVNRYVWKNLPAGLSSQELERLIYYRYSLIFFYYKDRCQFHFLPYALNGTIDLLGRYNTVNPVPIAEQEDYKKSAEYRRKVKLLQELKLNVVKDVIVDANEITEEKLTTSCVILRDYTNQMGQLGIPRAELNDDLLDVQADCICFMRTNLLVAAGVEGLRVQDADCASEVDAMASKMYSSALKGNPYTAITAPVEIQELQNTTTAKASEFFLALQSVDNILLSSYGIENTGTYEKKAHVNESEYAVNATNISLSMQDGLTQRQNFCNIANSLWGTFMWCEIAESVSQADMNGDGVTYDESTDGQSSGHSVEQEEE